MSFGPNVNRRPWFGRAHTQIDDSVHLNHKENRNYVKQSKGSHLSSSLPVRAPPLWSQSFNTAALWASRGKKRKSPELLYRATFLPWRKSRTSRGIFVSGSRGAAQSSGRPIHLSQPGPFITVVLQLGIHLLQKPGVSAPEWGEHVLGSLGKKLRAVMDESGW